jgi:hypothetical protein
LIRQMKQTRRKMPRRNKNMEPKFSTMFCESYPRR